MKDRYGRAIDYLRLSITDRCNLRCRYCMPEGCKWIPMEEILTLEEMAQICQIAAALGIRKVKITGGEPLVRKGCTELVGMLKGIPGMEQVTLTTNGVLLADCAEKLKEYGLDGVNVSLDTLDRETYAAITGKDCLADTLSGIDTAERLGLPVKVNAVLQTGVNEQEWSGLVELARSRALDVRFIEMMPIGYGKRFQSRSNTELLERLREKYGPIELDEQIHGNGPAVYYRIPGFRGSVGFISAIHGKFCGSCNRVRLTSTGFMKGCLCYEDGQDLKGPVRAGDLAEVERRIRLVMESKPESHCFEQLSGVTELHEMSKIGG